MGDTEDQSLSIPMDPLIIRQDNSQQQAQPEQHQDR